MALSGWGKYPVPGSGEAADVPADMMQLVESMDAHTVLFASSVANRNVLYTGLPAGALVVCAALKTIWLSLGSGLWQTVSSDTGWVSLGFTYPTAGWSAGSLAKARNRNGVIDVRMSILRDGPDLVAADGNLTNVTVANIPSPFWPTSTLVYAQGYMLGTGVTLAITSGGLVRLIDSLPGFILASGGELELSAIWLEG